MKDSENITIHVDDEVGFKQGIETYGRVVGFAGKFVKVKIYDSDTVDTKIVSIHRSNIWHE